MKNKIALTAIFAVLMTRTILADTEPTPAISSGTTSAACESPAIGDATSGTVSYSAGWSNNVYTFDMFPDTSSQSSGVQNVCKFQDENETTTTDQLVDNTSGSCNLTAGNFSKPSEIITGWLMEDLSNPGSITIPVPYGSSPIPVSNIVDITNNATQQDGTGNEHLYNANLYANWGQCTANGSTPVLDTTDSKYKVAMANSKVEVSTSNNNCQYTVSCDTGYEIADNYNPCNATGVTWDAVNNTCTNSNLTLNTTIADCTSSVYDITLDNNGWGISEEDHIYEKYNTGWYFDANTQTEITQALPLRVPSTDGARFRGYYATEQTDVTANTSCTAEEISAGTCSVPTPVISRASGYENDNDAGRVIDLPSAATYSSNTIVYAAWAIDCVRDGEESYDSHSHCELYIDTNGYVTYTTSCDAGFTLVPGTEGTYNPQCEANDISLTWNRNANDPAHDDMTNDSNNSCTYGAGANDEGHIVVPQPTREGYTFNGWYIDD